MLAAALAGAGLVPASASGNFIARPTTPLDCRSPEILALGQNAWFAQFHGSKQDPWSRWHKENVFDRQCFRTETDCRNWLYNMLSEYQDQVWSAFCKKGPEH